MRYFSFFRVASSFLILTFFFSEEALSSEAQISRVFGSVFKGDLNARNESQIQAGVQVTSKNYVKTGNRSKAELQFQDATLARLGAHTVFTFQPKSSSYHIKQGDGLFVFPKGRSGSAVMTAGITAGIMGTTVYVKRSRNEVEYLCLEGMCKIAAHILGPGDRLLLRNNQQAYSAPKRNFDIQQFMNQHPLVTGFESELPSKGLIEEEIQKQQAK